MGATGLRPWRCRSCDLRFYAWAVALPFLLHAHCNRCGNFDLQRISREHVDTWGNSIFRLLQVPAYRCAPCRYRFFSVLPAGRIQSSDRQELESPAASPDESGAVHG